MTVSWGALGVLWHKPLALVVVRPQRYTREFAGLATELRLFQLAYRVLRRSWPSALLRLAALNLGLLLAAALLLIVPAGVFYLAIIWDSLH